MKLPIVSYAMKALWFVAIILLINMGLIPFGFNLFATEIMQATLAWLVVQLHYIAGIAGVLGLMKFVRACSNKKGGSWCGCGSKGGSCGCGAASCTCR